MRKLITFSPQQWDYFQSRMKDDLHTSPSAFIMQLLNTTAKRPAGRPRTNREDDADDENLDDVEMYKVPDRHTTSPYSYNDLVAWYQAHPSEGPMPERKFLTIHPNYKGKLV